jgi:hypothetical protein
MKLHIAPTTTDGDLAALFERKTVQAIDLWPDPAHRPLWKSERGGGDAAAGARPVRPPGAGPCEGYASPMGYWLTPPALPTPLSPGGLTITFHAPGEDAGPVPAALGRSPHGPHACARPVQTVRVKSPSAGDGDITLTIGPGGARVTATPAAWKALAEPVLLAACQYWRFAALDAEIARLTELAHGDLDHSNMPGPSTLRAHRRVVEAARDVRALMLDLPHFEGPLTDPFRYASSERSAQVFENLAEKLRLEEWCELIDERAEAIEDAYEALTEKLFEYKNFAWEAVLEGLIILILLGELALGLYEAFAP